MALPRTALRAQWAEDMTRLIRTWWGAGLALAICVTGSLVLWEFLKPTDPSKLRPPDGIVAAPSAPSPERPVSTVQAPASVPPAQKDATEPSPRAPVPEASRLFVAMSSAADLRVFAEAAKKEPGGYVYAIRAVNECRTLREAQLPARPAAVAQTQAALDPSLRAQAEALEWLSRRCEGFTNAELGASELKFLVQTAKERDGLFGVLARAQAPTADSASREASLGDALRSKDPTLISSVAWSMGQLTPKGDSSVVFVDGQPFGGLDAGSFAAAWSLATCSVTGTCGVRDSQVAQSCAFDGKCTQDAASLALADYRQADDIAKVRALAAQLEAIIASGDVRRLRPPARK
jgi:hypothetical protein